MKLPLLLAVLCAMPAALHAAPAFAPEATRCIAGAKPGGGFDLTCRLARDGLRDAGLLPAPMQVSYLPGGIGAVAFSTVVAKQPGDGRTLVAFSSGSLLNLAQRKFGPHRETDVRWLAAVAADHGVLVVAKESPYRTLADLMAALKADPSKVVFGAGGTVGSQDWFKAALTARAAGIDHRRMRFVAFEGGGEALAALEGRHVTVCTGDAAETAARIAAGAPLRVLAVMADRRLAGPLAAVPTAPELGYDIRWPIVRGFYLGPQVSDADFAAWTALFDTLLARPAFDRLRAAQGLQPFALTGAALDAHVRRSVQQYRELARGFGLKVPPE